MCYWKLQERWFLLQTVEELGWILSSPVVSWKVELVSGKGNGTPLQYSCLENPMGGGAWWAAVHGVAKSQTWLSNFTFTFHFHALEMEMATHSSVLAWRIPGTGELGGPPSMVSHRVGHDWSNLAAAELVSSEIGYLAEAISKQSVPSKGWLLLNTYSKMWEKKWLKEVTVSQRGSRNFKLRKFLFHHFAKKM